METFSLNVRHSKCVLCSGIFYAVYLEQEVFI